MQIVLWSVLLSFPCLRFGPLKKSAVRSSTVVLLFNRSSVSFSPLHYEVTGGQSLLEFTGIYVTHWIVEVGFTNVTSLAFECVLFWEVKILLTVNDAYSHFVLSYHRKSQCCSYLVKLAKEPTYYKLLSMQQF